MVPFRRQPFHRQLPRFHRFPDFFINELVIKSDGRCFFFRACIIHRAQASPINRADTHRARFTAGIKLTIVQLERPQLPASLPDRLHFSVSRRIVRARYQIRSRCNHLPILHNHSPERPSAPLAHILRSQCDRLIHPCLAFDGSRPPSPNILPQCGLIIRSKQNVHQHAGQADIEPQGHRPARDAAMFLMLAVDRPRD